MNNNLVAENKMIKNKIADIEDEIFEIRDRKKNTQQPELSMDEK